MNSYKWVEEPFLRSKYSSCFLKVYRNLLKKIGFKTVVILANSVFIKDILNFLSSSHLISSHLISSHLISSHLISSHLISSHLISSSHLHTFIELLCTYQSWLFVCLSVYLSKYSVYVFMYMLGLFHCYLTKLSKHLSLHEYLIYLILIKSFPKEIHETYAFDFCFVLCNNLISKYFYRFLYIIYWMMHYHLAKILKSIF